MGTPGVPFDVPKSVIVEALKRQHGRLTYACKDLDCKYETLKKAIDKDPELQQLLVQLRNQFDCTLLDTAESVLMKGMTQEDIGQALKASFYVLNNKGKERGYSPMPVANSSAHVQELIYELRVQNAKDPSPKPNAEEESARSESTD